NNSSKDYEIEGIEGAKLEELLIPKGKTRSPGYTVPDGSGVHKLKCYVPGGPSTIIELTAGDGSAGQTTSGGGEVVRPGQPASSQKQPDTTVAVGLGDYTVTPDKTSVQAGAIRFIVTNISKKESHELAVLKVKDDGSFENKGEVEPIGPEQGGAVTLDLEPGAYKLACLVTKGEEGSTVDHYQQGMHTDFRVE
ncbi:MAG: hypothetical protein HY874_11515, partial [Chloroflexi bacterium]|nr:hypothetical protein [Chloroflexota bacterium]